MQFAILLPVLLLQPLATQPVTFKSLEVSQEHKETKPAPSQAALPNTEQQARNLLEALRKADKKAYAEVSKNFTDQVKKILPEESFLGLWPKLEKLFGTFTKVSDVRTTRPKEAKGNKGDTVILVCEFSKGAFDFNVLFDNKGLIAGFNFTPSAGKHEFKPPIYAKRDSFREEDRVVGKGTPFELSATLALPKGEGPFPAVVLVHGSGPHDRDETIGPNKPLRDVAWGLASQGIATLRYIKRTKEYGLNAAGKGPLTIQEESIEDALAAVALLQKEKRIDPKRVYVVGHSLGGFVAPRIASQAKVAGIVLLAGNARSLEDLVEEQLHYLSSLTPNPTEQSKKVLEQIKEQATRIRMGKFDDTTPATELLLNLPGSYWKALKAYNPTATAAGYTGRILVLQGERDYQVTMTDFEGWRKALQGHKKATFKSYPALNHLFMEGKGKSVPTEYMQAGNVAREVIDDIVAWINKG